MPEPDIAFILRAAEFAGDKHRLQKRKDEATPYINHPLEVANILLRVGGVTDPAVLAAGLLHDTIEDTATTEDDLRREFGDRVTDLVLECTDDKSLPKDERKRLQVVEAAHKSPAAKLIKIADKISNLKSLTSAPPANWSAERRTQYVHWCNSVFAGLKGGNRALDDLFDEAYHAALAAAQASHQR